MLLHGGFGFFNWFFLQLFHEHGTNVNQSFLPNNSEANEENMEMSNHPPFFQNLLFKFLDLKAPELSEQIYLLRYKILL